MDSVFCIDDTAWVDLRGLAGARGYQFKALTQEAYTKAYSCELVRLDPGDHSVPHVEHWNHLLYILEGTGDITIAGTVTPLGRGSVCQVRAGELHSMRNLGGGEMLLLAIYDPPRRRREG